MMQKYPLTAVRLRLILSLSLFVIALITSAVMYFVYNRLYEVAIDVSHAVADSHASQDNIQTLQKVQKELEKNKDVIARAGNIVADSQSYQYQNQIISDLNTFAGNAGIGITNIDFAGGNPTGGPATTPKTNGPVAPTGVKSTSVSVTLQNPVPYDSLLRFIRSIEQNLTKMQISKVSLAKGPSGSDVTSEVLTIQVYVR